MNISSSNIEYFINKATEALNTFQIPSWAGTADQTRPIFRSCDCLWWKPIKGDLCLSISLGDQIEAKATFCPIVRLDGNIVIVFKYNGNHQVVREIDGTLSLITGVKARFYIRQALSALPRNERVRLEITIVHQCYSISHGRNSYKTIGQVVYNTVKL